MGLRKPVLQDSKGYILKIDEKQNSGGEELVIECLLGLLHDFSRFLSVIIITTQLKV